MNTSSISKLEAAWSARDSDRPAAYAASEAVLADEAASKRALALARVVRSYLDFRERRYERGAADSLSALSVLEANPTDPWLPRLYHTIAAIHMELGERDSCRSYLDRQIRLSHQLGDRLFEALGYHDLGLFYSLADEQQGLDTLAQAHAMFQAQGDAQHEALALYNMANIAHLAEQHQRALEYAEQALTILHTRRVQGMEHTLRIHLVLLKARIATSFGRHDEAQQLLTVAEEEATRYEPIYLVNVLYYRGEQRSAAGDDEAACVQFLRTLDELGDSGQYEFSMDCHARLSDCYERLGNFQAALAHQRAYAAVITHIFRESSEEKVRALEVIHKVTVERQRSSELERALRELERLHATMREMSQRDSLTHLYNRSYLAEEGERMLSYAQRYQTGFCAVMLDIDYFKRINDQFGHQMGDVVLQKAAQLVTDSVRGTDLVARYGGEEFVVLLPATALDEAYAVCERLRSVVAAHDWTGFDPSLSVTISAGLAADAGDTLAQLLASADTQLYESKRAGRNRTSYHRATEPNG